MNLYQIDMGLLKALPLHSLVHKGRDGRGGARGEELQRFTQKRPPHRPRWEGPIALGIPPPVYPVSQHHDHHRSHVKYHCHKHPHKLQKRR